MMVSTKTTPVAGNLRSNGQPLASEVSDAASVDSFERVGVRLKEAGLVFDGTAHETDGAVRAMQQIKRGAACAARFVCACIRRGLGAMASAVRWLFYKMTDASARKNRDARFQKTWDELQKYYSEWSSQQPSGSTSVLFLIRAEPRMQTLAALENELLKRNLHKDPLMRNLLDAQERATHWIMTVADQTPADEIPSQIAQMRRDLFLTENCTDL